MLDWNLALIDVAAAWVVVALPRYCQARLLAASGLYTQQELHARAIDERLSIDPVRHTSLLGTLLAPALTSLASLPVIAWGKPFDAGHPGQPRLALRLWLAGIVAYLVQAVLLAMLMAVLAKVYLAGAPVAARAGQLCLRMAILNLLPLPMLEGGVALGVMFKRPSPPVWLSALATVGALAIIARSGPWKEIDHHLALGFFYLSRPFL